MHRLYSFDPICLSVCHLSIFCLSLCSCLSIILPCLSVPVYPSFSPISPCVFSNISSGIAFVQLKFTHNTHVVVKHGLIKFVNLLVMKLLNALMPPCSFTAYSFKFKSKSKFTAYALMTPC